MTAHRTLSACAATALFSLFSVAPALAQFGQNDMVVGLSTSSDTYRVYDSSATTWSGGPGWTPAFMQSMSFDNAGGANHSAAGNLLACNFGNASTGFEIHNLATDGSSASQSIWGINALSGGANLERGGGVSVNPSNNKIAWAGVDTGTIFVLDYNAGTSVGTGSGASANGTRMTGLGDGFGNAGSLSALKPIAGTTTTSQGTTWLNDNVVLAFTGIGNLVKWDVSGVAPANDASWAPTTASNWVVANSEVSFDAQFTDVYYNAQIDANHIYASVTRRDFTATLYAYDYNAGTGAISLNTSVTIPASDPDHAQPMEPREIALDSNGNLYWSCYAGSGSDNIVSVFENATNLANWTGSPNIHSFFFDATYTGYNGFDVAAGAAASLHPGDANGDGIVNLADLQILGDNWQSTTATWAQADFTGDGNVNLADLQILGDNWGFGVGADLSFDEALAAVAIPEPAAIALLGCGIVALGLRRRVA